VWQKFILAHADDLKAGKLWQFDDPPSRSVNSCRGSGSSETTRTLVRQRVEEGSAKEKR